MIEIIQTTCPCPKCFRCCCEQVPELRFNAPHCVNRGDDGENVCTCVVVRVSHGGKSFVIEASNLDHLHSQLRRLRPPVRITEYDTLWEPLWDFVTYWEEHCDNGRR